MQSCVDSSFIELQVICAETWVASMQTKAGEEVQ